MTIAFIHREPSANEIEKLRLLLSTYQDGSGMLALKNGLTLPGWRDFERAVALAFNGEAQENKAIFDVLLTDPNQLEAKSGLSCKMRGELNRVIKKDGRVTIELSNSAGKFWDYLKTKEIHQANYKDKPSEVGGALLELVEQWYEQVSFTTGGNINLNKSFYLTLSWNRNGLYQLHQFPINLPDPKSLKWYFPSVNRKGVEGLARRLKGDDEDGTLFEWYDESGGQLKYYPFGNKAVWASEVFHLEPLPNTEYGILAKAAAYFPQKWTEISENL